MTLNVIVALKLFMIAMDAFDTSCLLWPSSMEGKSIKCQIYLWEYLECWVWSFGKQGMHLYQNWVSKRTVTNRLKILDITKKLNFKFFQSTFCGYSKLLSWDDWQHKNTINWCNGGLENVQIQHKNALIWKCPNGYFENIPNFQLVLI